MERDEYLARWGELHGMDPRDNRLVCWWLGLVHGLARPFVRLGASPDAVTLVGLAVSLLALPLAWLGGRWLLASALAVFAAYAEAHGVQKAKRFALQLKPNGTYDLYPCADRSDFGVFTAALTLWNWRKQWQKT